MLTSLCQFPRQQPCWGAEELRRRRAGAKFSASSQHLLPRSLQEEISIAATNERGEFIFPSEGGLDRWLYKHHFRYLDRPPVYADFGSNDPIFTSNTYFLDVCLGATGICVEANPQFSLRYPTYRSCDFINTCLSDGPGKIRLAVQSKDYSTRSGVAVTNKNGNLDAFLEMTCATGAKVFSDANLRHVDWLDLDAEGHELHILKGTNFSEVTVDIISVEANVNEVANYLQGLGYRCVGKYHYDDIFLRDGFHFIHGISTEMIDDCEGNERG